MKVVAVSRIKDEADIVEAFVRHNSAFVDHHIILDNGSTDGTREILARLRDEGKAISLFLNPIPVSVEETFNNILLVLAREVAKADWAVYLDCDEFLRLEAGATSLHAVLEDIDPGVAAVMVPNENFIPRSGDDPAETNVALRITHRADPMPDICKVMVRAAPAWAAGLLVGIGNHAVYINGELAPMARTAYVRLAHFYRRSATQEAMKSVVGRLRVLASPIEGAGEKIGFHYTFAYDKIKRDPMAFLNADAAEDYIQVVSDPIDYRGEPLRYTAPDDGVARFIRLLIEHAELQAKLQSEVLRAVPAARELFEKATMRLERIF